MSIHSEPHPMAGQVVTLASGATFEVEDWWDRVGGQSWTVSQVPVAFDYAGRSAFAGLPLDDQVVYGKDAGRYGHLLHHSELPDITEAGGADRG